MYFFKCDLCDNISSSDKARNWSEIGLIGDFQTPKKLLCPDCLDKTGIFPKEKEPNNGDIIDQLKREGIL